MIEMEAEEKLRGQFLFECQPLAFLVAAKSLCHMV